MAIWVLAAAAARARIFEAVTPTAPLAEIDDLVHPASRLKEQALVSDSSGSGRGVGGGVGHSVGHEHDAPEEEWDRFAREVAGTLHRARKDGRFRRLYLLAAPRFLGLLRRHLDEPTRALVADERDLDVTHESAKAIRARLPGSL